MAGNDGIKVVEPMSRKEFDNIHPAYMKWITECETSFFEMQEEIHRLDRIKTVLSKSNMFKNEYTVALNDIDDIKDKMMPVMHEIAYAVNLGRLDTDAVLVKYLTCDEMCTLVRNGCVSDTLEQFRIIEREKDDLHGVIQDLGVQGLSGDDVVEYIKKKTLKAQLKSRSIFNLLHRTLETEFGRGVSSGEDTDRPSATTADLRPDTE